MQIKFYINNNPVNPPENLRELVVDLNYDKDMPQAQVQTNKWRFVRQNAKLIEDHFLSGIIGGVGIFEGLPLRIEIAQGGQVQKLFDGYIDGSEPTEISCNDIIVSAKEKQKIDFLDDVADSVSFERLFEEGKITTADFVFVPYVINTVPNTQDAIISLITTIFIGKELIQNITSLIMDIVHVANPFEATFIITVIIRIVYVIFLFIVFIELISSFVSLVIQPVKYHAGMYVKDLFRIGATHFGFTFQSSIFSSHPFDKMLLIDTKYELTTEKENASVLAKVLTNLGANTISLFYSLKGFKNPNLQKQRGYYKGTFGDMVRAFKETIFNAKVVIKGSTMIFERRDYNTSAQLYQVPDIRRDYYSLNVSEFKSGYLIKFAHDINDKNTIDQYNGTIYQNYLTPVVASNPELKLMRNFERIDIPFALAKRKEDLTFPEQVLSKMIDIVNLSAQLYAVRINVLITVMNIVISTINTVIDSFNTINDLIDTVNSIPPGFSIPHVNFTFITNIPAIPYFQVPTLQNPLEQRKGMMLLENDFIDVPKLVIIDKNTDAKKTKIHTDNADVLKAKYLWDNYFFINSFAEINGKHNQYYIYEHEKIPFCWDDYLKVKDDNRCISPEGLPAEILILRWNVYGGHAKIKYRVNKKFTDNLKLIETISDGN